MNPQTIPWLFCSAICILPFMIGTGAFFAWSQFTNRVPYRDVSTFEDDDGCRHVRTEWVMLTREEIKFRKQPEDKE